MDLHSDFPYWSLKNGILRNYPALEGDLRCDALVVGGGITGALLADALSSAGIETIVLDRREIGHGSTSASTALLQYEIDKPLYQLTELVGQAAAQRAYWLGIEALAQLKRVARKSSEFSECPSLYVARNQREAKDLAREFTARKAAGLPVELLDRRDLRRHFGVARESGILSATAGSLDPYRLCHNILHRWTIEGTLRVFDRTTLLRYTDQGAGVRAVTSRRHSIRARRIFFATGFESQEILPERVVRLRSTYALASEPANLEWWKRKCLIWETGDPYLYARPTADGRVLVGGEDDTVLAAARRNHQTSRKARVILRKFSGLFPESRLEPAYWWSGMFGTTRDGLPYIGVHKAFPRAYFALGFGGNGITFSVMAARILRDLFLNTKNRDAELFRFER